MMDKSAGRLAFRVEGKFWNCYYAELNTMEGAQLLGSIHMVLVEENKKTKRQFQEMMKGCLEYLIENVTHSKVDHWEKEKTAPFWERKE